MTAPRRRPGMTAIEVLASTLLAALLMCALIGVLRGLKAQERALDLRSPKSSWQQSLDAVITRDLASAQTVEATPLSLTLRGYAGRDETGIANWLPSIIIYEVRADERRSWLVRRELATLGGDQASSANLVLAGVKEIRVGTTPTGPQKTPAPAPPASFSKAAPLIDGMTIEFWGDGLQLPLYKHVYHAL